jgi:hypothetical protein
VSRPSHAEIVVDAGEGVLALRIRSISARLARSAMVMFAIPFPFEFNVPPRRLLNASPPATDGWTGFCCAAGRVLGVIGLEFVGVDADESMENTSFCGRRAALFSCGDGVPSFWGVGFEGAVVFHRSAKESAMPKNLKYCTSNKESRRDLCLDRTTTPFDFASL